MVTYNPIIPFYLMEKSKEFRPGVPPINPKEEIAGFEEAIEATKKRIEEHQVNNWDASVFETHLRGLEQCLKKAKDKAKKKAK